MKKKKVLSILLACTLCLPTLGAAAEESSEGTYTPGTYTASSVGHEDGLTVTITVDESSIVNVEVDASNETAEIGGAAADDLAEQILAAQSTEIDGVSGATETTDGVKRALADCLDQAMGTTNSEQTALTDGTYTASSPSFGLTSQMTCEITIEGGAITDITVVEESDSATGEWFASAEELYIPRVIENQSLAVDAITGATTSSNAIRNCVADAIDQAGGDSSEWYTKIEKSTDTVVIDDYDVIVVGLGGSGILSYCAAADSGATVFGIEAAGKVGGNSVCTYGPMALNSVYRLLLYTEVVDFLYVYEVFECWREYVGSDEKADVIYEAVYNSGSALDYYVENFDFEFEGLGLLGSFVVSDWTQLWCVYTADEDNTSWNVLGPNKTYQFTRALDIANDMNEKNQYMTELTAESLIFDEDGTAIGITATYYDGTTYEIYGKSIILATGGFLGNDEMMVEYLGSTVNTIGDTVNDGTGIQMGISAGGATYMMSTLPMVHNSQVKNIIRTDDLTADQKAILTALALTTDQTMITNEGNIWGNENQSGTTDEGVTVEIVYAPDYMYYVIYTQEDIDNIRTSGLSETQAAATSSFLSQGGTLPEAGTPVEDIDEILTVGEEYDNVIVADNLADLAAAIGCDEANLTAALGEEETTWYAIACCSYAYATVGGLNVDVNMNVLREDGTPIENLYAVGQDSEGVCNVDGEAYTPWGGQAQSWTFVSGQIAGTQAAAYALAQ
ncbi:MAG: FMN-binding protein [Lachnospiraceae bacterium]|nr:FMN-binding protein [Lachnospiraceae bacterium]